MSEISQSRPLFASPDLPNHVKGTRAALFYLWGSKGGARSDPARPSAQMPKVEPALTAAQMCARVMQSDSFEFWD